MTDRIRWVRNGEIDKIRWNDILDASPGCPVYACSWYLDIVAGSWDALIWGDYEHVMPLPFRKKWGIRYVYPPFFAQQLGIFPEAPLQVQREFSNQLSRSFRYISYQASATINPECFPGFYFTKRRNRCLLLQSGYGSIARYYSQNTRRNLAKADKNQIRVISSKDIPGYLEMKKRSLRLNVPRETFITLLKLMEHAVENGTGRISLAMKPNGEITAGAFFLIHHNRCYYLNAFSTEAGMNTSSAFVIVDQIVREYAGTGITLDFEGSEIDGIDRFYRGFGAGEYFYYHLTFSRLPDFLLKIKKAHR